MTILPAWRRYLLLCLLLSLLLIALFWPTVEVMITTWSRVETYSHGFLIVPISAWLVWRMRAELAAMTPHAAPEVLALVGLSALGWAVSRLLGIQVLEQLAFVAVWVTSLWALLGHRLAWQLAFPLLFLFLMVPMGDALVPPMMEFTADFTVTMLELTGIPVYREGLNFVVPSGSWSVVEACSGVRYLIASGTLGLLYAYLNYRALWRRLVFVVLALLVPVLANGIRAYLIVMIGHLSDMRLAVGVDHLIYGWVFFGLVMLLLFWLGSFWTDTPAEPRAPAVPRAFPEPAVARATSVLVLALLLSAGVRAGVAQLSGPGAPVAALQLPATAGPWHGGEQQGLPWPLALPAADQVLVGEYNNQDGAAVTVVIGLFAQQRQGAEVVSSENRLLTRGEHAWRITGHRSLELGTAAESLEVPAFQLTQYGGTLLGVTERRLIVARWYRFAGRETASDLTGKLYEALGLLLEGRHDGAYVMLATDAGAGAGERLQSFATQGLPVIWQRWDQSRSAP